ncbi:hypothetical protein KAU45_04895 [bacterium]|nr:hypothetical protein [bacterium]
MDTLTGGLLHWNSLSSPEVDGLRVLLTAFVSVLFLVSCADRFDGWELLSRPSEAQVRDLVADDDHLYLATLGDGAYVSSDEGVSWNRLPGTEGMDVHCLSVGKGGLHLGTAGGVFRFDGDRVELDGLEDLPVWSLDGGDTVVLAGSVGAVYARTGSVWRELPPGLSGVAITAVLGLDGETYAGTLGEGLWVLRESIGEGGVVHRWTRVEGTPERPLDAAEITLLYNDSEVGRFYVGTMWGGLYLAEETGFFKLRGLDPEFKYVSDLIFVEERLFITTCGIRADGLYSADLDGRDWRLWRDSPHPARGVVWLSDYRLLVATEYEGLYAAYPPETHRLKLIKGEE